MNENAFILSWRPTNIATIALMVLVIVFVYALASQLVRFLTGKRGASDQ